MLSITLKGPHFERGQRHGQRFAAEIAREIRAFCPDHWLTSPEAIELGNRLMSSVSKGFPELALEMIGISRGAGIPFEQVLLLNLVLATNDLESDSIAATFKFACSAIGFAHSDYGPLAAKNCDERQSAAPFYLFQKIYPDDGYAFMGIANVGTLWLEGGMNEKGLALMQTAGPVAPDQDGYGIPCNIVPRVVLSKCATTAEAIAMLEEIYSAGWGMGLVIADEDGRIAIVEKSGALMAVDQGNAGVGFCTNHFEADSMQAARPIPHPGLNENSRARLQTLRNLFHRDAWPVTLTGIKEALGYHGEYGFVCQHGDANLYSNYSCIAIPKERKILLGDGFPCSQNYTEYCL
jgi:predicted choloylglycine hydrolase